MERFFELMFRVGELMLGALLLLVGLFESCSAWWICSRARSTGSPCSGGEEGSSIVIFAPIGWVSLAALTPLIGAANPDR